MIFKNAKIFTDKCKFLNGGFSVNNGKFESVLNGDYNNGIDLKGAVVIPGLVDIHTHGNSGIDFTTTNAEGLSIMSKYLAYNGITSFTPTSLTAPYIVLENAYKLAKNAYENRPTGAARILGIYMEGNYFSHGKKGVHEEDLLKLPDFDEFKKLYDISGGIITTVAIAPELPGAMDFIRNASELCTVSFAHSEAGYECAQEAFSAGIVQMTHLFNAMMPIEHRNPGPIPAAAENENVYAELICDGVHVHPSVIRMAFKMFSKRIIMITDSLSCCGMPDGHYFLGEKEIVLKGKRATALDGTIAGSASNLFDLLKETIKFGIPAEEVITACTIRPAMRIGKDNLVGSIECGKYADFIICDEDYNIISVYISGEKIR